MQSVDAQSPASASAQQPAKEIIYQPPTAQEQQSQEDLQAQLTQVRGITTKGTIAMMPLNIPLCSLSPSVHQPVAAASLSIPICKCTNLDKSSHCSQNAGANAR